MLNLVTIGKHRINVDHIIYVVDLTRMKDEEIVSKAIVWLSNLQTIVLDDMDALTFLNWWDGIAADVHALFE